MKKINKKNLISIFIFLIIILLSISIIILNNSNNKELHLNKEKIYYEIRYLDLEIIDMFNLLNNDMNWNQLQNKILILYNSWNSMILDLNNLDIDKIYLTNFGKDLDNLAISINDQNRKSSLENLIKLYERLIVYIENSSSNESYINIFKAKYHLLKAYIIAETGNWTLTYENVVKSDQCLLNVVNSIDNNRYNQYNINLAYISVKELENLINIKDFEVFYIKYSIALNKIENIQFDFLNKK